MADSKRARTEPAFVEESYAVRGADGEVLRWPRQAALRAGTLKDWIEDTRGEGEFPTPLPGRALWLLLEACAHDDAEAGSSPASSMQLDEMADLLHAAHFLEASSVFEASSSHLCGLLGSKSVEALRSALGVACDLSADEQAAALIEPLFTLPAANGPQEEVTAAVAGSSATPPSMRRSFSTRLGNEDVIVAALSTADTALLCRLKAVSLAWRTRARSELCARVSCRGAGQPAPASLDEIVDLDVEQLFSAGHVHEAMLAGRQLPSLMRLRGWGFVVDVPAVRQADLTTVGGSLIGAQSLRGCVAGEGAPPRDLLLAGVACAGSGEVLLVPVQQLREGNLVELDLSMQHVGVGGVWLLALLLPMCSKLVRLK